MLSLCDRLIRAGLPYGYVGNRWLDLALIAGIYAGLLALFMRAIGLGARLRDARRHMLAAAFALLLYRRTPSMVIRGEATLVFSNLKYLLYLSPTLAFGGFLFAAAWDPLAERYGSEPAQVGQELLVSATGTGDIQVSEDDFALEARARVPKLHTAWAKLRPRRAGVLPLQAGAHLATVNVDMPGVPSVAWRHWNGLTVHVSYPAGGYGWVLGFLGLSAALMGLARVQV